MMRVAEVVLADLRSLVADLGRDGGWLSPAVYDTAQRVRLAPPEQGCEPALDWILSQQRRDGGWGNPAAPHSRDAPTLAALLALHAHRPADARAREAAAPGVAFLEGQREHWRVLTDDLPVGAELTVPNLLNEAAAVGLAVPREQYAALLAFGEKRLKKLAHAPVMWGTPFAYSWDAWGKEPDQGWMDVSGGIGTSPSATAAWLRAAANRPELAEHCARARRYLARAEAATGTSIPGVVTTVFPIERMEQEWGLLALMWAGLLGHPGLADVVQRQADELVAAMRKTGAAYSDSFLPDGDCTGTTVALLYALGRPADVRVVKQYEKEDHFVTYPGEMNPALSTTAHCVLALSAAGEDISRWHRIFAQRQDKDGRWPYDKWHVSWLYPTTQVLLAFERPQDEAPVRAALQAILRYQRPDGGWGMGDHSTAVETAYAVLALRQFRDRPFAPEGVQKALGAAHRWLLANYRPFVPSPDAIWIGKEDYCPYRVDRAYELAALLALTLDERGPVR